MRWKSTPAPRKKRIDYEQQECIVFFAFVRIRYPDLVRDLQRHECGGSRGKVERAKLQLQGEWPGFPDYFLYYPSAGYHGLAIEMKKQHNGLGSKPKATPLQLERLQRFRDRGYEAKLCLGADEAIKVLGKYLRS